MAGSLVDTLVERAAGAAVGVSTKTPKLGGTLTVGLVDDVSNPHTFNGAQGQMDDSAFCLANALYDPLFVMAADGKTWLPMLALSATPNANYTTWTIALRQGVSFTNGDPFNAAIVVANYNAAAADPTVGLAIKPIIASVTQVDDYTVDYNLLLPFATFPIQLSEQQISYMAHPNSFQSTYAGNPIGTGPFAVSSWTLDVESVFTKNTGYWRKDAAGRQLPYLDGVTFKTIPDPASRNEALQSGTVDMILQQTGAQIAAFKSMSGVDYVTDIDAPRDPEMNCLLVNTTGTMNQYYCWAGEFAPQVPGALSYLEAGNPVPTAVQEADYLGTLGAVNPSSLQWDTALKPVLNDVSIRQACVMAINREVYHKIVDGGVGEVSNGLFRASSPFYKNPGYPAYNPKKAKELVEAYKKAKKVSKVSFVIDIVSGSSSQLQAFSLLQQQLAEVGIEVTSRSLLQSALILNAISGQYDCAAWSQFGGVDPSLNYVWFTSIPARTAYPAGLGLTALPAGTNIAGAVNFAHQGDATVQDSMAEALAAKPGSAAQVKGWETVNSAFANLVPYLWLDTEVNAFAARSNVQNFAYATAADGTTRCLNPDGGSCRWDQIWLS